MVLGVAQHSFANLTLCSMDLGCVGLVFTCVL